MGAIIIQSDDSLMKLFLELARKTGAKAIKINTKAIQEFETGERLKKEKIGKLVSEEEILAKLKNKMNK